ncbi:phosphomevalonate kinase [Tritrichomonas musculus]|uniref:phosphomevalonate kinase n=1 Tax=Tritrichomonas musculus TaxID=1915356 RepID=A0ABR2KGF4_9EUKA
MEVEGFGYSKCMILGGYLATNRQNTAIVLALSPKVKCSASFVENSSVNNLTINVTTHPFKHKFSFTPNDWLHVETFSKRFERFILSSFHVFFTYMQNNSNLLETAKNKEIQISITGDPEFYTSKGKTGLGSSSATTVAIIKCLLNLFPTSQLSSVKSVDLTKENLEKNMQLIFKMASVSHSIAQGNIGSCFDISCSVWGSQMFRRPSTKFVSTEMLSEKWDNEHMPFKLPSFLKCYLLLTPFDGSSTVQLVRCFNDKSKQDQENYEKLKQNVSNAMKYIQNGSLEQIQESFRSLRHFLRNLSITWDIEIVPPEVDEIASKVETLDGVVAVVIPGAGGYDSIAVLTKAQVEVDFSSLNLTVIASNSSV